MLCTKQTVADTMAVDASRPRRIGTQLAKSASMHTPGVKATCASAGAAQAAMSCGLVGFDPNILMAACCDSRELPKACAKATM